MICPMEQASDETLTPSAVETPAEPAADAAPQAASQPPASAAGETPIPPSPEAPVAVAEPPEEPAAAASEPATPVAEAAAPVAEQASPAPAAVEMPAVKRGGFKPRGPAIETELAKLLPLLYADYDLQVTEPAPGTRFVDLWLLPDEAKTGAPAADKPNKWPPRTPIQDRKRDYQLHVYASTVKDPSWGVPGKDILGICANRGSGLLLMMADQKGYFLPSHRLGDLAELFSQGQASIYKITGTKLRKAAVARYFSLAGMVRELVAALAH